MKFSALAKKVFLYSPYIPNVILSTQNWYGYLKNLGSGRVITNSIQFRSGLRLRVYNPDDSSSISVIFFKKEYGQVQDNWTVIDMGANRGYFSTYAAFGKKNVRVYAYEPVRETYATLVQNIAANSLAGKIVAFNQGVAGADSVREFTTDTAISNSMIFKSADQKTEQVQCTSLATIIAQQKLDRIDLLKMDCEGAEFEILFNAPENCLRKIKEIRMEYHNIDDHSNIRTLADFLKKNNFSLTKKHPASNTLGIAWFKNSA